MFSQTVIQINMRSEFSLDLTNKETEKDHLTPCLMKNIAWMHRVSFQT